VRIIGDGGRAAEDASTRKDADARYTKDAEEGEEEEDDGIEEKQEDEEVLEVACLLPRTRA